MLPIRMHTSDMQHFIPRNDLVQGVKQRLAESPVTALLGAREVGKTTLARLVAKELTNVTFYDLERDAGRAALRDTPELALSDETGVV